MQEVIGRPDVLFIESLEQYTDERNLQKIYRFIDRISKQLNIAVIINGSNVKKLRNNTNSNMAIDSVTTLLYGDLTYFGPFDMLLEAVKNIRGCSDPIDEVYKILEFEPHSPRELEERRRLISTLVPLSKCSFDEEVTCASPSSRRSTPWLVNLWIMTTIHIREDSRSKNYILSIVGSMLNGPK